LADRLGSFLGAIGSPLGGGGGGGGQGRHLERRGRLECSVRYEPPVVSAGVIIVQVEQAEGILDVQAFGAQDPYVSAALKTSSGELAQVRSVHVVCHAALRCNAMRARVCVVCVRVWKWGVRGFHASLYGACRPNFRSALPARLPSLPPPLTARPVTPQVQRTKCCTSGGTSPAWSSRRPDSGGGGEEEEDLDSRLLLHIGEELGETVELLHLDVWNENTVLDDAIGSVDVELSGAMLAGGARAWYDVSTGGRLELSIRHVAAGLLKDVDLTGPEALACGGGSKAAAAAAPAVSLLEVDEASMRYGPVPPGRDCALGVVITLKGAKPADLEIKQLQLHLEGEKLWESMPVALAWVIQKSFMPLDLAPGMVDLDGACAARRSCFRFLVDGCIAIARPAPPPLALTRRSPPAARPFLPLAAASFPRGEDRFCAEIGIGTKQNGTIGVRDFKIRGAVEMLEEEGDHPFTCRLVAEDSDTTLLQITAKPSTYLRALADNGPGRGCFWRGGREASREA
jgi:hypothetical protein